VPGVVRPSNSPIRRRNASRLSCSAYCGHRSLATGYGPEELHDRPTLHSPVSAWECSRGADRCVALCGDVGFWGAHSVRLDGALPVDRARCTVHRFTA
jgi:hypothetical protein